MPLVSVIVPTYDRAASLRSALASMRAQTLADHEVIVVDDGSRDGTLEMLEKDYPEVRRIALAHGGSPGRARNHGLSVARGTYIAFLDSDDLFRPRKLEIQVAALESHPDAALVYSDGVFFRDDPERPLGRVLDGMPAPSGNAFAELLRGNFLFPAVVLVRERALQEAGDFDESLRVAEDYDLWLRLAARRPFHHEPADVAAIRRHAGCVSCDTSAVRRTVRDVLETCRSRHPGLVAHHRNAFLEGLLRARGGLARAEIVAGRIPSGLGHATGTFALCLRHPALAARVARAWCRRSRLRGHAAEPGART